MVEDEKPEIEDEKPEAIKDEKPETKAEAKARALKGVVYIRKPNGELVPE
jgi:hypothetical protein